MDKVISLNCISIAAFIRQGPLNTAVIYMQSEALFCCLCRLLWTQRCAPPPWSLCRADAFPPCDISPAFPQIHKKFSLFEKKCVAFISGECGIF